MHPVETFEHLDSPDYHIDVSHVSWCIYCYELCERVFSCLLEVLGGKGVSKGCMAKVDSASKPPAVPDFTWLNRLHEMYL